MKKLNVILNLILAISLASPSAVYAQGQAKKTINNPALNAGDKNDGGKTEGGNSGGGGNTKPTPEAIESNVEYAIKHVRTMSKYVLLQFLTIYQDNSTDFKKHNPDLYSAFRLIFSNKDGGLWNVLKTVKIETKKNSPCEYDDEHKEGSANVANKTICMSISEILAPKILPGSKVITRHNILEIQTKVMGLFLHELTHIRGGNEAEADAVHETYELTRRTMDYQELSHLINEAKQGFQGLIKNWQDLIDRKDSYSPLEFCSHLSIVASGSTERVNNANNMARERFEAAILDRKIEGYRLAMIAKAWTSVSACLREDSEIMKPLPQIFGQDKEISAYEFYVREWQRRPKNEKGPTLDSEILYAKSLLENIMIQRLSYEDFSGAVRTLSEAIDLAKKAADRIQVPQVYN